MSQGKRKGMVMSKERKKMGRPTINPRNMQITLRLSEMELEMLNECSETLGIPRTDVIVNSVKKMYEDTKKKQ